MLLKLLRTDTKVTYHKYSEVKIDKNIENCNPLAVKK